MCGLVMGQKQRLKDLSCRAKLATIHHGSICFVVGLVWVWVLGMDVTQSFADAKQVSTPELTSYS